MNINDFNEISEQEKALQKAKDRFFRQYKVDTESFSSQLFLDKNTGQLGLEILPKKTNSKEPFIIIGDDIKILYNLVSMLFNTNEIKKETEIIKKKEVKN